MNLATIEVKRRTDLLGIVKFHLINKLVFEMNEDIIQSDIVILSYLVIKGEIELRKFCYDVARSLHRDINPEEYSIKEQSIRNRINNLEKRGFIVKNKKHNKTISVNAKFNITIDMSSIYKYSLLFIYEPIVKR